MDETFPEVEKLMESEDIKFRTQSLGVVDDNSLKLARVDENISRLGRP